MLGRFKKKLYLQLFPTSLLEIEMKKEEEVGHDN
jgi:hypothetical protein